MFILAGNLLLWLLSFMFIYFIHNTTPTLAQPDFLSYYCENAANYSVNSAYQQNLNSLSALFTTNNPYGFYNLSTGQGNNTVNSVALCRGDINPDVCLRCLIDSLVKLRQLCPNQKEAIGYYDYCMLRYSNDVILGSIRLKFYVYLANPQNAMDIDRFNGALGPLMKDLRVNASAGGPLRKFASGSTTGPDFSTIYGLVQCTPGLSELDCVSCLEDAINRIAQLFNGKIGGRMLLPMCTFRYENYRFFNQSAAVIQPSAPPNLPPIARPSAPPGMNLSVSTQLCVNLCLIMKSIN
ncbi:putative Gnk2-like domain-containing protein [Helianthus annuus]|nr:putative Gnk2-like domain-containing protein [Helianthus annuus]